MNVLRRYLIACVPLLVTGAAAAQTTPPMPPSETVARALVEAMAASDGARIRALFAPNAAQAYGSGAAKSGDAFFSWLQSDIIDAKGRVDAATYAANGKEVVITGQYSNKNGYRAPANFLLVVEDTKIVSWRMRY